MIHLKKNDNTMNDKKSPPSPSIKPYASSLLLLVLLVLVLEGYNIRLPTTNTTTSRMILSCEAFAANRNNHHLLLLLQGNTDFVKNYHVTSSSSRGGGGGGRSSILFSSTTTTSSSTTTSYQPIFDFSLVDPSIKHKSARSFERIDDAVMGGISTSALRDVPHRSHAVWSGTCRTDGGGFCGVRTLPFAAALNATGQEGMYMDCALASDDEADRRVWIMTVRTDSSRGEVVYQAEYDLKRAMVEVKKKKKKERVDDLEEEKEDDATSWARVLIPFDEFRQVRGPRLVPDGPKLDTSRGMYQIGLTMSKFKMARNTTELENFRPGYFELRIRRIGFYKSDNNNMMVATAEKGVVADADTTSVGTATTMMSSSSLNSPLVPDTLSKEEAANKRPLPLKLLLPMARLFFSERANRRKSAMRILREERNMSRLGAMMFGVQCRKKSAGGVVPSMIQTFRILSVDVFRAAFKNVLKVAVVYPVRLVGAVVTKVKTLLGMRVKPSLRE